MAVTTSSGNGFALYNGVKLPNIDGVWVDKASYPYAIITSFDAALVGYSGSSTIYLLDASGVAHYNNNGVCYKNPPYLSCSWFCSYDPDVCAYLSGIGLPITVGEWGGSSPSDIGSGSAQSVVGTVFWSNVDILNPDGSVYLSASDPIPLDGMNVIEWDGDTTGLTTIDMSADGLNLYKISAETPVLDELYGGTVASLASGTVPIDDTTSFQMSETLYVAGSYLYIALSDNTVFGSYTFPEKGIYSPKMVDGSDYVTILAYPASGGGSGGDGGDTSTAQKHYCRVNGSVHEVEGGTARVSGSYHEIEVGTVRIEGAYYEIGFDGNIGGSGGGEEGGGSLDGVIFQAGEGLLQGTVTATPNNPSFTSVISYSVTDSYITTKGGNVQQTVGGNTVYIPAFYILAIGPFDATDYDTLHVELTSNIGVVKCESGTDSVASGVITNSATAEEVTLDISGLSGECNVVIGPNSNITSTIFNATIYKIWLT